MKKNNLTLQIGIATAAVAFLIFSLPALAEDSKTSNNSRGSDKVDLKKLEDKYWSAKDDEYGVIQNRTFSKTGKFYGSLVYGPLVNDSFAKARALGGMLGYYINEDFGVELSYLNYSSSKNDTVVGYEQLYTSAAPNYNLVKANKSLSLTYTPFYAKMAFMNKAILYFDMGFTLGAGLTDYEIQKVSQNASSINVQSNESKSAPHYEIGVMQQLFINQSVAFRLDIKNTFYTQKVQQYNISYGTPESSRPESSKSVNDTTITFGLTLFTK